MGYMGSVWGWDGMGCEVYEMGYGVWVWGTGWDIWDGYEEYGIGMGCEVWG